MLYVITPLLAWFVAGSLKFTINFFLHRQNAFKHVGLGGFPSTHTTVVMSTVQVVGLREGLSSSAYIIALTLAVIVIIDAMDLRQRIGRHAERLNALSDDRMEKLREKIGHRWYEVMGGIFVGILVGTFVHGLASIVGAV